VEGVYLKGKEIKQTEESCLQRKKGGKATITAYGNMSFLEGD